MRERMKDWGQGMCRQLGKKMVELTGYGASRGLGGLQTDRV